MLLPIDRLGVDIDNTNVTGECSGNLLAEAQKRTNKGMGVLEVAGTLACNTGPNGNDAGNFACNQAVDAGHVLPDVHGHYLAVRKLTPEECEALQGFPNGWTSVGFRGRLPSDGMRYRAIGNSMAVNCMNWLSERINSFR